MNSRDQFILKIKEMLDEWEEQGMPPRWTLLRSLQTLREYREKNHIQLFPNSPVIMTATLDDGWGIGIDVIHKACEMLGISHRFLGLLVRPGKILKQCGILQPDFLGLTVLHETSLCDLKYIIQNLSPSIMILVGGLSVDIQNDHLSSGRIHYIRNVSQFIRLFL